MPASATSSSRKKFCAFRVPICSTSAYFATTCTVASDITSVTTGRPVSSRACASSFSPSSSSPRKLYGDVRGLNAPPRSIDAPRSRIARAVLISCSSLSIAHGPAITDTMPSPTRTPFTLTIVSSPLNSRLHSLYGLLIGTVLSTPGITSMSSASSGCSRSSPTTPITVRSTPTIGWPSRPASLIRRMTSSNSVSV